MSNIKLGDASGILIVNFAPFLDATDRQGVADAMLESFKDAGFVYLVNHPLPERKIKAMFDLSKKFFSLPMEIKMLAPHPPSGTHHRGKLDLPRARDFTKKVTQHGYDSEPLVRNRAEAPDVKESFECGREVSLEMPNIWLPEGVLPGFKETCLDFYWTCNEVELVILKALALAFHLSEDYFASVHMKSDNQLRFLHYPSVPAESLEKGKITRIGAHSDFASITLLLQDGVGGLEIEDPKNPGIFKPAPYVEGALIVNAGDFMMRWSNDIIRSTVHRVRAPTGKVNANGMTPERYSIPYFCAADLSTVVDCVPGTWSEANPKKYEPISAGEYIMKRLAVNY
ncbi:Clavaminate synthase-like protein [Hysterangium stoloniferum]|nr:Clavaminate synthase-like protein [Hysterangium stoloniferum]